MLESCPAAYLVVAAVDDVASLDQVRGMLVVGVPTCQTKNCSLNFFFFLFFFTCLSFFFKLNFKYLCGVRFEIFYM